MESPQSCQSVTTQHGDVNTLHAQGTKPKSNSKPRKGKAKVLYFWSSADVNRWLKKHCRHHFQLYGDLFIEHDISGRALIRLSNQKLQEIGIEDSNHREDLLRNILRLKLKTELQELKTLEQRGERT